MKIKDVSQQTGLTKKTIRFYEAQGLLFPEKIFGVFRKIPKIFLPSFKLIGIVSGRKSKIWSTFSPLRIPFQTKPSLPLMC